MPLITLEHTENIDRMAINFDAFFAELHKETSQIAATPIKNCQSRAICLDQFYAGNADEMNAFINLEIYLLEGRSPEIISELGHKALDLIQEHIIRVLPDLKIAFNVRIPEMPKSCFFRPE